MGLHINGAAAGTCAYLRYAKHRLLQPVGALPFLASIHTRVLKKVEDVLSEWLPS